jgi:hypothetical protein
LIIKKYHNKIGLRETVLVLNTSTSRKTALATEAHLAEGQFLLEEQTLNEENLS